MSRSIQLNIHSTPVIKRAPNLLANSDMMQKIFEYLTYSEQLHSFFLSRFHFSLLSSFSCSLSQSKGWLQFKKIHSVMKMSLVHPNVKAIFHSHSAAHILAIGDNLLLINDGPPGTILIRSKDGVTDINFNVLEALDEREVMDPTLRHRGLYRAIWLSDDTFVTLTIEGTLAWWSIDKGRVLCRHHSQLYSEEQRGNLDAGMGGNPSFYDPFILKGRLYIPTEFSHRGPYTLFVVDMQSYKVDKEPIPDKENIFKCGNTQMLFSLRSQGGHLQLIGNCQEEHTKLIHSFEFPFFIKTAPHRSVVVGKANDDWIVIGTGAYDILDKDDDTIIFYVFDARVKKYVFDFTTHSFRLRGVRSFSSTFLCGDFFVIMGNLNLRIYDLRSKKYCTQINLENLCDCTSFISPVRSVEITYNKIRLILQRSKPETKKFSLDIVEFNIDNPIDQDALHKKDLLRHKHVESPKTEPFGTKVSYIRCLGKDSLCIKVVLFFFGILGLLCIGLSIYLGISEKFIASSQMILIGASVGMMLNLMSHYNKKIKGSFASVG